MKRFEFKQRVPLDIAGHLFSVTIDADVAQKLTAFGAQAEEMMVKDPAVSLEEAWAFMAAGIDGLLGEGATAVIFENRPHILEDAADVMNHIAEEIRAAVE